VKSILKSPSGGRLHLVQETLLFRNLDRWLIAIRLIDFLSKFDKGILSIMDLHARPYRCFIAVAETGSFSRAADRLHISQPALSAQIKELERRLGFLLFARTSRLVTMTSEGHLFLPNARRLVAETEIANRAALDIRSNQLRIGTPVFTGLIAERRALFDAFARNHGEAGLHVINDTHVHCLAALRDGDVDLVITLLPVRSNLGAEDEVLPPSMEALAIAHRDAALLIPHGHALSGQPLLTPAALAGVKVARLGRVHGRELADSVMNWLSMLGADAVRPPEGNALAVELHAQATDEAAISLGWWPWLGGTEQPVPTLARVDAPPLVTTLALVRKLGRQRPAANLFWEMVRDQGQKNPDERQQAGHPDGPEI
jgi:DNA-binding transcriptional LysR family regulator